MNPLKMANKRGSKMLSGHRSLFMSMRIDPGPSKNNIIWSNQQTEATSAEIIDTRATSFQRIETLILTNRFLK